MAVICNASARHNFTRLVFRPGYNLRIREVRNSPYNIREGKTNAPKEAIRKITISRKSDDVEDDSDADNGYLAAENTYWYNWYPANYWFDTSENADTWRVGKTYYLLIKLRTVRGTKFNHWLHNIDDNTKDKDNIKVTVEPSHSSDVINVYRWAYYGWYYATFYTTKSFDYDTSLRNRVFTVTVNGAASTQKIIKRVLPD